MNKTNVSFQVKVRVYEYQIMIITLQADVQLFYFHFVSSKTVLRDYRSCDLVADVQDGDYKWSGVGISGDISWDY